MSASATNSNAIALHEKETPPSRILVVDDNPSIHEDFRKILTPRNQNRQHRLNQMKQQLFGGSDEATRGAAFSLPEYQVDSAYQGEEALLMVRQAEKEAWPYSLVFMDMRMPPGDDGLDTIVKLWKQDPSLEIVICTAYSDYTWERIIGALGTTDRLLFLKKPFEAVEVQQMALSLAIKWQMGQYRKQLVNHLEQTVEQRSRELDEQRAKSLYASRLLALGEMAGGVAHEVNNPLAVIVGKASQLVQLLEEPDFDRQVAMQSATKIEETAMRIARIIKGLRSVCRDGSQDPFIAVPLSHLIEDTLSLCRQRFENSGVTLRVQAIDEEVKVYCRPVELSQVFLNLLSNAFDAALDTSEKWVKVQFEVQERSVQINFCDSGAGVPEELVEKIFHPFFTTKPLGQGTGLGLSISKTIIQNHKGQLDWVPQHPEREHGFVVRLPLHQAG